MTSNCTPGRRETNQAGWVRSCTVSTIFASASPPPLIYNTHTPHTQVALETMEDILDGA